ncbi:MAG: ArsR/SmtB family transcription factor [Pyrinomonadaceae bacterium]
MDEAMLRDLERLLLALSDKTRLKLLALMADGEVSVGYLADNLGESQPKISRHLAYLRSAGLVSTRRDGKWIYYAIERGDSEAVMTVLDSALACVAGKAADPRRHVPPLSVDSWNDSAADEDWHPNDLEIYLL